MISLKLKLVTTAFALVTCGLGPKLAQAAPMIGANSIATTPQARGTSVETVRYHGIRHWHHHRHGRGFDAFPVGLLFGTLLGAGLSYGHGDYGYGYAPADYGGCF